MKKIREFYVWPKRKDDIFGVILSKSDFASAINEDCLEKSFLVREVDPAFDALVLEMVEALKLTVSRFYDYSHIPTYQVEEHLEEANNTLAKYDAYVRDEKE